MRYSSTTATRRRVLAAFGGGATALTSGCLRQMQNIAGWQSSQVELQIKTLPADSDPYALRLSRTVAGWFRAAGIDTGVVPVAEEELLRQSLLQNEFDLFVMRLPQRFRDPDALTTLLHSRYADAPGWQNPFGYVNLDVDDLLDKQRRANGPRRRDLLVDLQQTLARTQPFTLLAVPDDIRAARSTAYTGWRSVDLRSPLGVLSLDRRAGADGSDDPATFRAAMTDGRATTNLNPLSVESRRDGVVTGLLYDPLGHVADGELQPWLADSWTFTRSDPPVARVDLREELTWHDGEPLTAEDVVVTYDLLADTTLGSEAPEGPVPSPQFRGRSSLIRGVDAVDATTVELRFVDVDPSVARRAFRVPILPAHVWTARTGAASLGGIEFGPVTEALVTNNLPPVGSGPLQFVRNTPREGLVLERFPDHFLHRSDSPPPGLPERVGIAPFDRFAVRVTGSDVTAVELVANGDADVTLTSVGTETVPRIGRSDRLDLLVGESASPYVLGYNVRQPHLNNPRVRNTLASLVDGAYLVDEVLDGYGRPAVGPLWGTEWFPSALEWSEGNPITPFLGNDGTIDVERARTAFRETGYRYDDDGRLLGSGT